MDGWFGILLLIIIGILFSVFLFIIIFFITKSLYPDKSDEEIWDTISKNFCDSSMYRGEFFLSDGNKFL